MKITTQTRRVNPQRELLACFDVSKATLNLFCRYEQDQSTVRLEDQFPNATGAIEQTGPLADFSSKRALLRYAGVNLRERTSGQYRGQTGLSKKGRPLLRKVLGQTVFPVLRRDRLYGPYYHKKRQGGMQAQQAIVAVMRKFLGVLWALARSGEVFDGDRFCRSESPYRRYRQAA